MEGGRTFFFQLYETACLQWLGGFSQGFTLWRYFPARLLLILNVPLLFQWLMDFLYLSIFWNPSRDHLLENGFTWLSIWLVLISWSAWEPVSHFPTDPKEQNVTTCDATSPTAIHCSRAPPDNLSNHQWPWELSYSSYLTWLWPANWKSSSLELVAHGNLSHTHVYWACALKHFQAQALEPTWIFIELMCLFFCSVCWQAILTICH